MPGEPSDSGMIECVSCGAHEASGSKFCGSCGAALPPPGARACPSCRTIVPEDARFCDTCGTELPGDAQPEPEPDAPTVVTPGPTCPACGAPHAADVRFCGACGHPIAPPDKPVPESIRPTVAGTVAPPPRRRGRGRATVLTALLLMAVAAGAAAAVYLVGRSSNDSGSAAATQASSESVAAASPPPLVDATRGRPVFVANCSTCHTLADANAKGQVGPDLDQSQASAEQIRRMIDEGGGSMPPFKGTLTELQIADVTAYIVSVAGARANSLVGDPTRGKLVFAQAGCIGCHTLAAANATGTVGPNLDDLKPTEKQVRVRVENGGGPMPSFTGVLTQQQIADVAAYVASSAGNGSSPSTASVLPSQTMSEKVQAIQTMLLDYHQDLVSHNEAAAWLLLSVRKRHQFLVNGGYAKWAHAQDSLAPYLDPTGIHVALIDEDPPSGVATVRVTGMTWSAPNAKCTEWSGVTWVKYESGNWKYDPGHETTAARARRWAAHRAELLGVACL